MTSGGYRQFCPVAMASEILCTRWTLLLLRELYAGSTRFNELRRGLPRMSPALLSQRLKELQQAGVVEQASKRGASGSSSYRLTAAGQELGPVIEAIGVWGQRWIDAEVTLEQLDVQLLMWDMRRNLNPDGMGAEKRVVQFVYPELPAAQRAWWMIIEADGAVDLCSVDPGFDVDLYASSDLRTMTAIWMGLDSVRKARAEKRLHLTGDKTLAASMQRWLGLSPFAPVQRRAS